MFHFSRTKRHGFTLIELLVVIAIIGILSTLAIVALSSARQKARDSKRVADLSQIGKALELYYNDNNTYPTLITPGQPLAFGSTTYLAQVPSNPTPRNDGSCGNYNYIYEGSLTGSGYTLSTCLSSATGAISAGPIFVSSASGSGVSSCGATIVDRDGYTYRTVQIGSQCWMADNLSTKTTPAGATLSALNRDCMTTSNTQGGESDCLAGRTLYKFSTVMNGDSEGGQGICPAGWHVPSDADWHVLEMSLVPNPGTEGECPAAHTSAGSCLYVGDKLKVGGSANFNGAFSGSRDNAGNYGGYGNGGYWWSSHSSQYYRAISTANTGLGRNSFGANAGLSVRCLKN